MDILEELRRYAELLPEEITLPIVERAIAISPEKEVRGIIPSIAIHADGLALTRVLLVTDTLICEIRFGQPELDIDFIAKKTIFNYRLKLWVHEVKSGEEVQARYEMAEIAFIHGNNLRGLGTAVDYAGTARSEWLSSVLRIMPVDLVSGT